MFKVVTTSSVLLLLLFAYAAAQTNSPKAGADILPDGPGKDVVQRDCLSCHNVHITTSKRGDEDDWANTVSQMIGRGANISDDDADTIVEYMAAHFGPSAPTPENAEPSKSGQTSPSQPASPPSSSPASTPAHEGDRSSAATVNVNKAGIEELESSLDLSKADAQAIVHYRKTNGDFNSMQQLLSVPGVDTDKIKKDETKIVF
jgi:competence protein ComEA